MSAHPRLPPHRPRPHQLIQAPPSYAVPPPLLPAPPPRPAMPLPPERRARRRRLPRFLADGAFWSGVLTALSVTGLLVVIVAAA